MPVEHRKPLAEMISGRHSGILLLGLTPPRLNTPPERVAQIAEATVTRLGGLDLDGVVLYDIDDESDRTDVERPFPYLPTMDPAVFHADWLQALPHPAIIYRCVGKYADDDFRNWLGSGNPRLAATVFVGPSTGQKATRTSLPRAHEVRGELRPDLAVGGVAITERYKRREDEHRRMLAKQARGCTFFVTQVVYDADATKSLLSEYYYACTDEVPTVPIIFTLSVCGSLKTLEFLQWLGVDVPRWLENALRHDLDPLERSFRQCVAIAEELIAFCQELGLPYGFNVESVSIRKAEIEASVRLAERVRELLDASRQ